MRRPLVLLACALVLLSGCTQGADRSDNGRAQSATERAPVPAAEPVDDATTLDGVPAALPRRPSTTRVIDLSRNGEPSRLGAEAFALNLAQLLVDTRDEFDAKSIIDEVGAEVLPTAQKRAIVAEIGVASESGFRRYLDSTERTWLRSAVIGSEGNPEKVEIEIARVIRTADPSYTGWEKVRMDIVRQGGAWRLASFGASPFAPDDRSIDRGTVELGDFLDGSGWRDVEPSS